MPFSDYLKTPQAHITAKCLDYLDGRQLKHVEAFLNDPQKGRKKWKERGIVPRYRNLTQMIVEKSGLLFIDATPSVELYDDAGNEIEQASTDLKQLLDKSDWIENFINVDSAVRLLKTVLVLIQINPLDNTLIFDVLHQGNSAVLIDPQTREVNTLIYRLSESSDESEVIRVITNETIIDYKVDCKTHEEVIINQEPNPYGIIPAVKFNDTRIPRCDYWNPVGYDLVQMNELYNIGLCDSEYAASWNKLKTLFTNAKIVGNNENTTETVQIPGRPLPTQMPAAIGAVGGPGAVMELDGNGDSIFCEYLGPDADLLPIDEMFNKWIRDFAADWSVNVKSGSGTANSGFQLVVEEIDNMTLRQRRHRMFEAGFRRMYQVLTKMIPTLNPNLELYVEFEHPKLPVDIKQDEEVWSIRINEGRASIIDYLMSTQALTRDEAEEKLIQINEDKLLAQPKVEEVITPELNNNTEVSDQDTEESQDLATLN